MACSSAPAAAAVTDDIERPTVRDKKPLSICVAGKFYFSLDYHHRLHCRYCLHRVTTGKNVVPVIVADYGYHSTIIFPKSDGGIIEYAYGDWSYFGHNEKSVGNACMPSSVQIQATLDRRLLDRDPRRPGLAEAIGAKVLNRFDAPPDKVLELEWALDRRFSTHLDSIVYPCASTLFRKRRRPLQRFA